MFRCPVCGLTIVDPEMLSCEKEKSHEGLCCDCFDEAQGMSEFQRTILRAGSSEELVLQHRECWEKIGGETPGIILSQRALQ